jgi:DNA-binding transcriptional regulator YhcF (GntR family)
MITIDPSSSVPPFEQLRSGIAERIRDGRLPAGTKLPPVRRLAESLDLAPNTVARAYRELEIAKLVATAGRRGTVVAATGDEVTQAAAEAAADFADTVHRLGLPTQDAVALARAALEARDRQQAAADAADAQGAPGTSAGSAVPATVVATIDA